MNVYHASLNIAVLVTSLYAPAQVCDATKLYDIKLVTTLSVVGGIVIGNILCFLYIKSFGLRRVEPEKNSP